MTQVIILLVTRCLQFLFPALLDAQLLPLILAEKILELTVLLFALILLPIWPSECFYLSFLFLQFLLNLVSAILNASSVAVRSWRACEGTRERGSVEIEAAQQLLLNHVQSASRVRFLTRPIHHNDWLLFIFVSFLLMFLRRDFLTGYAILVYYINC